MSSLDDDQIARALADLPEWEFDGEAITKTYAWASFGDAIEFVNDVAEIAEDLNHHPDLEIYFDEVVVSLRTHSADAVTERDVEVAREIEEMLDLDDLDDDLDEIDDPPDADDARDVDDDLGAYAEGGVEDDDTFDED